jgi:hypothetical protein
VVPSASDPTPTERPIAESQRPGVDSLLGVTLVTVADGIRVRSQPRISDDSVRYEPLLPLGTALYAFEGPVFASGYEWYKVASVSVRLEDPACEPGTRWCHLIYTGWVASQGRDADPWLVPGEAKCPPLPTDVGSVLHATAGARLACFSRIPITFEARLIHCNCDIDGGFFHPGWFGGGDSPYLLIDPTETSPPEDYDDWLIVDRDPAGTYPDVLPVGQVVRVTGMFDHPAAEGCLYQDVPTDVMGPPTPSSACRFMFATTAIAQIEP